MLTLRFSDQCDARCLVLTVSFATGRDQHRCPRAGGVTPARQSHDPRREVGAHSEGVWVGVGWRVAPLVQRRRQQAAGVKFSWFLGEIMTLNDRRDDVLEPLLQNNVSPTVSFSLQVLGFEDWTYFRIRALLSPPCTPRPTRSLRPPVRRLSSLSSVVL